MKQSRRIDWRGDLHQFSCLNMQIAVVASSDLAKLKPTNIGKSSLSCLARVSLKAPEDPVEPKADKSGTTKEKNSPSLNQKL